ncbi:hypothetical protein BDP81DRAFT_191843 [Colletotrichum phormii]|uniref:Uncharacterized protein n=1 Tax=Colletotrichum phormii TaxID=359342 RepID=A0AAI9ZV73_9PEZI|nr:uncharacterized protein BDP81DRAFT_191843 [Colletotrichum phormii]KAK1638810.1 hypothetical protein BDP81DRAFT_191843 [Colletotrichum phormii]
MTFLRTFLGPAVSPSSLSSSSFIHRHFQILCLFAGGEREREREHCPQIERTFFSTPYRVWVLHLFFFFPCSSCRFAIHLRYGNVHSISYYPDHLPTTAPQRIPNRREKEGFDSFCRVSSSIAYVSVRCGALRTSRTTETKQTRALTLWNHLAYE